MFARILEFVPLMEKKDEFIRVVKKEVPPISPTPKLRAPSQLWRAPSASRSAEFKARF
jgi:hypothetical protein